jgi:hypothetical protein
MSIKHGNTSSQHVHDISMLIKKSIKCFIEGGETPKIFKHFILRWQLLSAKKHKPKK